MKTIRDLLEWLISRVEASEGDRAAAHQLLAGLHPVPGPEDDSAPQGPPPPAPVPEVPGGGTQ